MENHPHNSKYPRGPSDGMRTSRLESQAQTGILCTALVHPQNPQGQMWHRKCGTPEVFLQLKKPGKSLFTISTHTAPRSLQESIMNPHAHNQHF